MTQVIDVHAHILSEETMRLMCAESSEMGPRLSNMRAEGATLEMMGRTRGNFPRLAWDVDLRLKTMADTGVDMQVLSVVPHTLVYNAEPQLAQAFAQIQNEQIAAQVRAMPDRFAGLATLPLQSPAAAAQELRRAMKQLGLKGAMLGSHIEGKNLDDPDLEEIWEVADELGAFIFIHPQKPAGADRTKSYYLSNLIGNPLDTTIAAASLVFGGVFQRHPNLKVMLSHGGGFTPYQVGRFVHGWHERAEAKVHLKVSPEEDFGRFFYDTLTHSQPTLRSLIEWVGSGHVLFGTDYPFDMGEFDCAAHVKALNLPRSDEEIILGKRAAELLSLTLTVEANG
ncbi:amidohydrolase [Starkeya sp. ORNL1]|uniref:amidohydrolase family protein n=1 Tax=Starkeya sp. ORNL1 TaxID=2709380 RepID=UPI00146339F6|nr:amidohydrolase family protein [Starkeya sp. ORNL1]QJP13057.1 amidohydrolase [Starkeya sp. ORNL1]